MTNTSRPSGLSHVRWRILFSAGALLLSFLFSLAISISSASDRATGTTMVVPVTGMSCVSCAATIKRTVKNIDGVSNVEVSLAARTMRVTYAPARVSPDRIVAAVNALGYQAGTPVEAK